MRIIFLFFAAALFGQIREIAHFQEVEQYSDPNTMVLFDIDDTLLVPAQMLGSDTWFEYRLKQYQNTFEFAVALEKTLAEWEALRHISRMELVEPGIALTISSLQQKGNPILGITIQGLALATRTVLQLQEHHVDLSITSPCRMDYCFPIEEHTVLYRKGILFTSGKPKGISFFQLCDQIGYTPKRLVAVDDKLKHLESLEREAEKRGVEFIGLRYGFSDAQKAAFSPEIAEIQLEFSTLTHILSDDEAKERMGAN